jgi:hypothetical protein
LLKSPTKITSLASADSNENENLRRLMIFFDVVFDFCLDLALAMMSPLKYRLVPKKINYKQHCQVCFTAYNWLIEI